MRVTCLQPEDGRKLGPIFAVKTFPQPNGKYAYLKVTGHPANSFNSFSLIYLFRKFLAFFPPITSKLALNNQVINFRQAGFWLVNWLELFSKQDS